MVCLGGLTFCEGRCGHLPYTGVSMTLQLKPFFNSIENDSLRVYDISLVESSSQSKVVGC